MFEILIFGDYQDYNMVDELPDNLITALKIKLRSSHHIFDGTFPAKMIIEYASSFNDMKTMIMES